MPNGLQQTKANPSITPAELSRLKLSPADLNRLQQTLSDLSSPQQS